MFRKIVLKDKETLGILESTRTSPQSTLISVHRSRIIEVRSLHVRYAGLDEMFFSNLQFTSVY